MVESKSRLAMIIGAILGGSLAAFCAGLLLTVLVIVPVREGKGFPPSAPGEPTAAASPSAQLGPIARTTSGAPSPTATYSIIIASATPRSSYSSPMPSPMSTVSEQPTTAPPSPTPTAPPFPFHYVEGSRVEELQCTQPYLQGWVKDASGAPLNGVTIRWQYWNNAEYVISGDPQLVWRPGEFKFTYYAENPGLETDFVLQVVESKDNPLPLSEPLQIHYAGCNTMGQITNIVFEHY
jgi:hypothetical protein